MKTNTLFLGREMDSPVGSLTLLASPNGLAGVYFEDRYEEEWVAGESAFLDRAEKELGEYFSGQREVFEVALDPVGTDFQRAVWKALENIPFGEVVSYLAIAEAIGNPKAVRAVGLANGANPISIIVPCHRVIGANGKLTGYGGGLDRKRHLLVHEKAGVLC
ncbi:methylated-DNA--[protein]-cysteine S-methyltransferase [Roseibacillus persicicus]|uniref:methylated-DNA--[protein]-cysteine S-methyltransferase n=1 Tax=Roseibacillus persicicus TaxID=454148 RepID=UPI002810282D|nr:methylated-DNA--[protein]-cysteine S-methyltransferase [Roseibacillus persicicus]MDQ8189885.1 methylated-DNA--[protein]-cysteine S-methyltransferase [Roseibacillus persicicus]